MSGNVKQLSLPLSQADIDTLRVGDVCRVSGVMYTARDAAHARLCAMLDAGEPLPVELDGICMPVSGCAGRGDRPLRADHVLKDGRLCAPAHRPWPDGHDRQGKAQR